MEEKYFMENRVNLREAMFGFGCKESQGLDSRMPLWENTAEEGKWGGQGAGGEQVYDARMHSCAN